MARYPHMNEIIEMHPLMGSDILNKISREINNDVISSLEEAETIIPHHHKKWDGTGYPPVKGRKSIWKRSHCGCV